MLKSLTLFLVVALLGCTRAACPLTGDLVIPHEEYSTKYVVCREGSELILSCDDGTIYNPITKRCVSYRNWLERAPTCLFNQTETVYFPHETSCSMFYTCAHGVTNVETCPEGLEYHQELWACDWPSPNGCFAQTTTPPPTESTTESTTEIITNPTTESTTEIITDPTTESTTEIVTEPTESPTDPTPIDPPVKCPINGTEIFIPHPTDCTKFYICWDETPTMMECFFGYEFSIAEKGCVPISDSGCTALQTSTLIWSTSTESSSPITDETITEPTESPTDPTTESTTEIVTEPTESPTDPTPIDPSVKCPINGTEITFIPHPTDCAKFYICWDETPTMMECFFGYEFNIAEKGCVLISDSGCTALQTSTESSLSITDSKA